MRPSTFCSLAVAVPLTLLACGGAGTGAVSTGTGAGTCPRPCGPDPVVVEVSAQQGTFVNCTIAGNTAGYGGALFSGSNGVTPENTVISGNDCKGEPFPAGGVNLGFMGGETCISGAMEAG